MYTPHRATTAARTMRTSWWRWTRGCREPRQTRTTTHRSTANARISQHEFRDKYRSRKFVMLKKYRYTETVSEEDISIIKHVINIELKIKKISFIQVTLCSTKNHWIWFNTHIDVVTIDRARDWSSLATLLRNKFPVASWKINNNKT